MNKEEKILKEMLNRATNPNLENVDELGVQMFCIVVRNNSQLIQKALEMIEEKIRSGTETESIRAISLLEECMTSCGSEFQDEVAKFRFMNDLIRLVSIKHDGEKTPAAVKKRIMECLLLWTTQFPQKTKIKEVYAKLSEVCGVEHKSSGAPISKRESVLGMDEETFVKLIQTRDPENLKRANLLVQLNVKQARRNEQYKHELQEVQNTVDLFNQMIDTFESEGGSINEDTMALMKELYSACKKHKPVIQRLPEMIGSSEEKLIPESLVAYETLEAVMVRYKETVVHQTVKASLPNTSAPPASNSNNIDLLSDLLNDIKTDTTKNGTSSALEIEDEILSIKPKSTSANIDSLDELREIFGSVVENDNAQQSPKSSKELFNNLDLLEPEAVPQEPKIDETLDQTGKRVFRELKEIDEISEQLFKTSLPIAERTRTFKKEPEKLTLNDLVKEKRNVKPESCSTPTTLLDNILSETLPSKEMTPDDDLILSSPSETEAINNAISNESKGEVDGKSSIVSSTELPFKHLSDISIDLDNVIPTSEERVLLDDDDVKVTLNFTEDRPSRHVSVMVISVINKSKMQLKDFQFDASVKKPCKVRLLPPTDVEMPPHKPFRPPTPINQVMLLLNPTGVATDVICIVGYKLGDDPDPIKESVLAKNIPFFE